MRDRVGFFARGWAMALAAILLAALGGPAGAAGISHNPPPLPERLTPDVMQSVFPEGADRLGEPEGSPQAVAVYKGDEIVAYIFSTFDVVAAPGYSGVPFDVIAGVRPDGVITGAKVIYHHEAYIERDPVRQQQIAEFLVGMAGTTRTDTGAKIMRPDYVAGATVSARNMRAAVFDAARLVLRAHGGRPIVTEPTLDAEGFKPATAAELIQQGLVVQRIVTNGELPELASAAGLATTEVPPGADPQRPYVKLSLTLATPAMIGRNILGTERYKNLFSVQPPRLGILVATSGTYDFLGINYLKRSKGFALDRVRIVQGDLTVNFVREQFERISGSTVTLPDTAYAGVLWIPPDAGFDPLKPWHLELLVHGAAADGSPATLAVPLEYDLPPSLVLLPEPEPLPAWMEAWIDARFEVAILLVMLLALTLIMVFQGRITRHRRLHRYVRNGFLVFTLGWLGWTASAQLSTIHLMNYALAPFRDYGWTFYVAEPLIVILVVYTLVSVVLIGRGVFCGWLCPFGAMQELLANIARFLRLPQWNPSERVQKWAWLGKYVTAAVVVVVAFGWPEWEATAAEVEPFKTAITSMFTRPWPFVAYAVILLGIGLFTERAYCRFLCPLGGILAVLDRLHILTLLKRRPECGNPCHLCERSCPVRAIQSSGKIKMAECFQCLDCQVEYHDDHRCPPLAKQRKQRARGGAAPALTPVRVPVTVRAVGRQA